MTANHNISNSDHKIKSQPVLVFARQPELGRVKTRLAADVGPEAALRLYRAFVADVLATVTGAGWPAAVWITPPATDRAAVEWLGPDVQVHSQCSGGLGRRMAAAFRETFTRGAARAVLMGTDVPDLPPRMLSAAMEALGSHGASLIPTLDGGYCLIGFRRDRFLPAAFESIPWGTKAVAADTLAAFHRSGHRIRTLPPWRDIDDGADLAAFARGDDPAAGPAVHTRRCLAELGLTRGSGNRRFWTSNAR